MRRSSSSAVTVSEPGLVEFAADIDEVCADVRKKPGALNGFARLQVLAAVGETVGRDVDDAHQARAVHRNAGDGGAWGDDAIKQTLHPRLGDRLDCAYAHDRVLDLAGLAFPEADRAERNKTASQRQRRSARNSFARNVSVKQADRLKINAGHCDRHRKDRPSDPQWRRDVCFLIGGV